MDYPGGTEPTLIFSVVSLAFYGREFSSYAAYRIGCSQIAQYRACTCSCHPYMTTFTITVPVVPYFLHNLDSHRLGVYLHESAARLYSRKPPTSSVKNMVDWENSEWHGEITPEGTPRGDKANAWKAGYHNGRAMIECLEILKRWRD
ncbi:MAG: hypothetical protein CEE38_13375 [Planctomycetes bacterium B3_Pla]|nr:MAG: hypothetical protein CEE38_13375 [Planctomycetes bacterium B3_Pla]